MSALRLEVFDLLTASDSERARVREDVLAVQVPLYRPSEGHDSSSAAARVAKYVDMVCDTDRFAHFNTTVLMYEGSRPVACGVASAEVVQVDGRTTEIVRCGTNVAPEARNQGLISRMFVAILRSYGPRRMLRLRPRYYLGQCMSPITYHSAGRRSRHLLPGPRPTPPAMAEVYRALVGHEPMAVPEPLGSEVDDGTDAWIARTDSEWVRYFVQINPRFREGYAIPMLVEVDLAAIAIGMWVSLRSMLRRR